jgi:hypothetical protein
MSTFPGAFVPVAPPADGLRLAFVAARRRRNRKAGATGAAGLLAAVALLASTGGAGDRTLLQEPLPPSSTHGMDLLPGVDEQPAAPQTTSAPAATTPADVASAPRAGGTVAVVPLTRSAQQGTTTPSGAGVRASKAKPVSGPMSRSTGFFYTGGDLMCPARKQQEQQRGLCTDVFATQTTSGTMSITAEVCNVGTNPEFLSYETARETDVSVQRAGLDVWRWSLGRSFAETPHNLAVSPQQCVRWTTAWSLVDAHGVKVKAGSYQLVADMDADQVAGPDRHPSSTLTVS